MTMKPALILALGLASVILTVQAQTYKWKDSQGRTVISDNPPPASARQVKPVEGTAPPAAETMPAADAQKTTAEKDMEFRKRQQEAREKADKEAKAAAEAAQRREACDRARLHLQALESGRRMILPDGKGGETFLEDDQRGGEIERARKTIDESCK
jgi:Domain of unknown function (DUF4124)